MLKETARQFVLFCGVGVINTAVGLAVILALSEGAGLHYLLANVAGYAVGLCISFVMNKNITFSDKGAAQRQVLPFMSVFAVSYISQLLVLVFLVRGLELGNALSQIAACGVYTVISFVGNKAFTFRKSP